MTHGETRPMNDFNDDDDWQRRKRDEYLVPQFYKKRQDGRFVLMDKGRLSTFLQRRQAIDTVVQAKDGGAISIEEKIVRWPGYEYSAYCLETESCTIPDHESDGWMHYGESDYLLYCFEQEDGGLLCDLIEFQPLKEWFWPLAEDWPTFQMPTQNRTRGRLVPVKMVRENVHVVRFTLENEKKLLDSSVTELENL